MKDIVARAIIYSTLYYYIAVAYTYVSHRNVMMFPVVARVTYSLCHYEAYLESP